jgi:hypothetical protein
MATERRRKANYRGKSLKATGALLRHDCDLQVSIHFNGTGQSAPEIRVMPTSHRRLT